MYSSKHLAHYLLSPRQTFALSSFWTVDSVIDTTFSSSLSSQLPAALYTLQLMPVCGNRYPLMS